MYTIIWRVVTKRLEMGLNRVVNVTKYSNAISTGKRDTHYLRHEFFGI